MRAASAPSGENASTPRLSSSANVTRAATLPANASRDHSAMDCVDGAGCAAAAAGWGIVGRQL